MFVHTVEQSSVLLWVTQEENGLAKIFKTSADWVEVVLSMSKKVRGNFERASWRFSV